MSIAPSGCIAESRHSGIVYEIASPWAGAVQDKNTRYVCIGPVNKVINMLCCWLEDPTSEAFKRSTPLGHDSLVFRGTPRHSYKLDTEVLS